jgi:hypothetical protein
MAEVSRKSNGTTTSTYTVPGNVMGPNLSKGLGLASLARLSENG